MHISIFISRCYIEYFDEEYMKKFKFKKKLNIKKILVSPVSFFAQKLLIIFFLQMISLH